MTETKFTPGPWYVIIDDDGNPLSGRPSVQSSDKLDCGIVHWDGFVQEYWRSARGDKEILANARLIAAAPELYDALILALPYVETAESDDAYKPGAVRRVTETIRAALAKAVKP